jgi:hypothetical protein
MGAVWLAEHAMLGRRAAVKVLHKDYSARSEIVSRFFNEARRQRRSLIPESSRSSISVITPMAPRTS